MPRRPYDECVAAAANSDYIHTGTRLFWRVNLAMVAAAFCTFALIYCVQPLLPVLAAEFHVSPAVSSLALSLTTGVLALGMVAAGLISETIDRKSLMGWSMVASAALSLASAFSPNWHMLLATRALAGLALSGVPAVAMAYISEEIAPDSGGLAMGVYVGGTAMGGMSGRLLAGVLCDLFSWRGAVAIIGGLGLLAGVLFWLLLPRSRHFVRRSAHPAELAATIRAHWSDSGLRWMFLMGFLLMGSFVSTYNYLQFRLVAPPYGLTQSHVGLLFGVYVIGMLSSAWAGRMAGRRGPGAVVWRMLVIMLMGLGVTLARPLGMIVLGTAVVTFGFFGAHAVVSGWVGGRARIARAIAASLYLFAYYLGSSLVGTFAGFFWAFGRWRGVAAAVGTLLLIGWLVSLRLSRLEPPERAARELSEGQKAVPGIA
ncbi:MAG: MFS transporter [Terriglobales bacterium]